MVLTSSPQTDMFDVLDELIAPLNGHISLLLTQPISGSDDERAHAETKKAYLALLNSVMSCRVEGVFISQRMQAIQIC